MDPRKVKWFYLYLYCVWEVFFTAVIVRAVDLRLSKGNSTQSKEKPSFAILKALASFLPILFLPGVIPQKVVH